MQQKEVIPHLSERICDCIRGDRKAQKELYDALAPRFYPVCLRYLGSREAAQDALQDGFVLLFSRLDSYKGDGSFDGWARRIFINTCLMQLRKRDILKMSDDVTEVRGLQTDWAGQIEDLGYRELMRLIMTLPPGFRAVFNLYAIEGLSHKEIAQMLGITESTSRTQLSRARIWLQNRIKRQNNGK